MSEESYPGVTVEEKELSQGREHGEQMKAFQDRQSRYAGIQHKERADKRENRYEMK